MSAYSHHHLVDKIVITLKEVLCALVMMDICWVMTSDLVMVCGFRAQIIILLRFPLQFVVRYQ